MRKTSLASSTTGRTLLPSRMDLYAHVLVCLQRHSMPFFAEARPGTGRKEFSATLGQLASLLERGGREIPVKGGAGFDLWCDGGELSRGNVMVGLCTCSASGHSIVGPFSHLQHNQ